MRIHKIKCSVKYTLTIIGAVIIFLANYPTLGNAADIDKTTGLIKADGWQVVRNNCIACHSAKLITQNHATKNKWHAIIIWMQETQGLPKLDEGSLQTILTYLSSQYGPKEATRRASLDPLLMPKNPYVKILHPAETKVEKNN